MEGALFYNQHAKKPKLQTHNYPFNGGFPKAYFVGSKDPIKERKCTFSVQLLLSLKRFRGTFFLDLLQDSDIIWMLPKPSKKE